MTLTTSRSDKERQSIVVAANFTAEPLEESLRFWIDELQFACDIRFAPYNQVFQQLLDSSSLLSSNHNGLNVVLLRLEEWWRGGSKVNQESEDRKRQVERNAEELLAGLKVAVARSAAPYLLYLCPASRELREDRVAWDFLATMEKHLARSAQSNIGVRVETPADISSLYPVSEYESERGNELLHLPYSQEFFVALGTTVARRFYSLQAPPLKVLVLDCDNTLWRGVCGEDGAKEVKVDAAARALQEFAVAQRDAGMLLCLCSKNNEDDVWAVFEQNPGIIITKENIIASRVNWLPKSENLLSLAAELQLGLDSFVFLDDSAIELAEVQARCPEVLCLPVPDDAAKLAKLLAHVWDFDHFGLTAEDRRRSELYNENTQREALRRTSISLDEFLKELQLQVEISPTEAADLGRIAQLSYRTNQFNFNGVRRTEGELAGLCLEGKLECLTVKVRDRFGDYGTVGGMLFSQSAGLLEVDGFFLSCRALGRRVEHRMLAYLGETALRGGNQYVRLQYLPTQKNKPVREFLTSIGAPLESPDQVAYSLDFTPARLMELPSLPLTLRPTDPEADITAESKPPDGNDSGRFVRIGSQPAEVGAISEAIAARLMKVRSEFGYLPPDTFFERFLASIWTRFLHLDRVGGADNFFDLGGQSLSAMQIIAQIEEEFNTEFSLQDFLLAPVLADQARLLEARIIEQTDSREVEEALGDMEKGNH